MQNYLAPGNLSNFSFLAGAEQLICKFVTIVDKFKFPPEAGLKGIHSSLASHPNFSNLHSQAHRRKIIMVKAASLNFSYLVT